MVDYRAAWVPERADMDWDEAAAIAVDWIQQECDAQGVRRAVLVTHTKSHVGGVIGDFAARHDWTTPQSRHRVDIARSRPTLAYAADSRLIDVAASFARGSSLCVIESYAHSVNGWAQAAGALDLLSGDIPVPVGAAMTEALDRLDFSGNNGWTRGFGADQALRRLEVMRDQGLLDKDLILGDMLAKHHGHKAVDRLARLIEKVSGSS